MRCRHPSSLDNLPVRPNLDMSSRHHRHFQALSSSYLALVTIKKQKSPWGGTSLESITGRSRRNWSIACKYGSCIGCWARYFTGKVEVADHIKAPKLLIELFGKGAKLLLRELPSILDGSAKYKAHAQDDSKATSAHKLKVEESWISFEQDAKQIHNKIRAFAGWPGTIDRLQVNDDKCNPNVLGIKFITTRICRTSETKGGEEEILFGGASLLIPCAGSTYLEVLELQLPGKRVMSAADLWNGLQGQKLKKSDISIQPVLSERYG